VTPAQDKRVTGRAHWFRALITVVVTFRGRPEGNSHAFPESSTVTGAPHASRLTRLRSTHMSPAHCLYREDVRRLWGGVRLLQWATALVAVLALQLALTLIVMHPKVGMRAVGQALGGSELRLLSFFGLYSNAAMSMLPNARVWTGGMTGPWSSSVIWVAQSVPYAAFHFLLPAYAALSFAGARKEGREREWAASGLTPPQVVTSKGLALLLPFLALSAASMGFGLASYAGYHVPPPATVGVFRSARMLDSSQALLASLLTTPVIWLLQAALMMSIASLHARVYRAAAACYLVNLLLLPIVSLGVEAILYSREPVRGVFTMHSIVWTRFLALAGLNLAALGAVLPMALRALDPRPEEPGASGAPARPERIERPV